MIPVRDIARENPHKHKSGYDHDTLVKHPIYQPTTSLPPLSYLQVDTFDNRDLEASFPEWGDCQWWVSSPSDE